MEHNEQQRSHIKRYNFFTTVIVRPLGLLRKIGDLLFGETGSLNDNLSIQAHLQHLPPFSADELDWDRAKGVFLDARGKEIQL